MIFYYSFAFTFALLTSSAFRFLLLLPSLVFEAPMLQMKRKNVERYKSKRGEN